MSRFLLEDSGDCVCLDTKKSDKSSDFFCIMRGAIKSKKIKSAKKLMLLLDISINILLILIV